MTDDTISPIHDVQDIVPILRRYGEACVIWKKGYTANFKWFGDCANIMENMRARKKQVNELLKPAVIELQ